jgi:hypothetical protein
MFNLKVTVLATIAAATASSSISIYYTAKYKDAVYTQRIAEIERIANEALRQEREHATQVEHELLATRDKLELAYAENEKRTKALLNKYNSAISAGHRLRDPGSRSSCQNASSTNSSSTTSTSGGTGTELSEEASRFLLHEAARADTVVEQLNLCKAWARTVKELLDRYQANQANQDKP